MFSEHTEAARSPFPLWLPITLGLLASAIVDFALCPVPRAEPVSLGGGLLLAFAYVTLSVGTSTAVLVTCGAIVHWRQHGAPVWQVLPLFCSVASWIAPMVAFYRRDSLWAVAAICVLAIFGSRLIYRHHVAFGASEVIPIGIASGIIQPSNPARAASLKVTSVVLQIGALAFLASMARPAALLIGAAILTISFCHQAATWPRRSRPQYQKTANSFLAIAVAILFVTASLTPYLLAPTEGLDSREGASQFPARTRRAGNVGLLQYLSSLFHATPPGDAQPGGTRKPAGEVSGPRPYPTLQAVFGESKAIPAETPGRVDKKSMKSSATAIVTDNSYPGMIMRAETEEKVAITAPAAHRPVLDGRPGARRQAPVSIPFYGAYWFYRASDRKLPENSLESRGDPASISFKTTDYTPISMEARQDFGTLIDLSCCRTIEVVIANADRRPGTIAVEMTLVNSTLPGKPEQSLGICPVRSSLRWTPDDNRAPVSEVLLFRVPARTSIQQFDEVILRFELSSPRERWSARVSIEKFRLVPGGL